LLPIRFLRQLIRFYGDSMQMFVPSYLEFSIERLTKDSQKFREQLDIAMSGNPLATPTRQMFQTMEEQARKNMAMFHEALDMFSPFGAPLGGPLGASLGEAGKAAAPAGKSGDDLSEMRAQLAEMQKRIDNIAKKE
jgi:polyhydroxyalkanoate synthesis regulator protein